MQTYDDNEFVVSVPGQEEVLITAYSHEDAARIYVNDFIGPFSDVVVDEDGNIEVRSPQGGMRFSYRNCMPSEIKLTNIAWNVTDTFAATKRFYAVSEPHEVQKVLNEAKSRISAVGCSDDRVIAQYFNELLSENPAYLLGLLKLPDEVVVNVSEVVSGSIQQYDTQYIMNAIYAHVCKQYGQDMMDYFFES